MLVSCIFCAIVNIEKGWKYDSTIRNQVREMVMEERNDTRGCSITAHKGGKTYEQ